MNNMLSFFMVFSMSGSLVFGQTIKHDTCRVYLPTTHEFSSWPRNILKLLSKKGYSYVYEKSEIIYDLPEQSLFLELEFNYKRKTITSQCMVNLYVRQLVKDESKQKIATLYHETATYRHLNGFSQSVNCIPAIKTVSQDMPACELWKE